MFLNHQWKSYNELVKQQRKFVFKQKALKRKHDAESQVYSTHGYKKKLQKCQEDYEVKDDIILAQLKMLGEELTLFREQHPSYFPKRVPAV